MAFPKKVTTYGDRGQTLSETYLEQSSNELKLTAWSMKWFGPFNPYYQAESFRRIATDRIEYRASEGYFFGEKQETGPWFVLYDADWNFGGFLDSPTDQGSSTRLLRKEGRIVRYTRALGSVRSLTEILFSLSKMDLTDYFLGRNLGDYDFMPSGRDDVVIAYRRSEAGSDTITREYDGTQLARIEYDDSGRPIQLLSFGKNGTSILVRYKANTIESVDVYDSYSGRMAYRNQRYEFSYRDGNVVDVRVYDSKNGLTLEWKMDW